MRHLDVALNADGLLHMVHDYTQVRWGAACSCVGRCGPDLPPSCCSRPDVAPSLLNCTRS